MTKEVQPPRGPDHPEGPGEPPDFRRLFSDDEIRTAYRRLWPATGERAASDLIAWLSTPYPVGVTNEVLEALAAVSADCARRVTDYREWLNRAAAHSRWSEGGSAGS